MSSIEAVRRRSWRMASARPGASTPTKLSQPVLERISSKSREKAAVTSSSPMMSSAMLAFIASVWACTSASVAFSTSIEAAASSPDRRRAPASASFEVTSATLAWASSTWAWLSRICWSSWDMGSSSGLSSQDMGAPAPRASAGAPISAWTAGGRRDRLGPMDKVSLAEKLALFDTRWDPHVVAEYEGPRGHGREARRRVPLARPRGRRRPVSLVLRGRIEIDVEEAGGARSVALGPGELMVVPAGVRHRPRAEAEAHALLIERRGLPNTGDPATAAPKPRI